MQVLAHPAARDLAAARAAHQAGKPAHVFEARARGAHRERDRPAEPSAREHEVEEREHAGEDERPPRPGLLDEDGEVARWVQAVVVLVERERAPERGSQHREHDARVVRLAETAAEERPEAPDSDEDPAPVTHRGDDRGATIGGQRIALTAGGERHATVDEDASRGRVREGRARDVVRAGDRDARDANAERIEDPAIEDALLGRGHERAARAHERAQLLHVDVGDLLARAEDQQHRGLRDRERLALDRARRRAHRLEVLAQRRRAARPAVVGGARSRAGRRRSRRRGREHDDREDEQRGRREVEGIDAPHGATRSASSRARRASSADGSRRPNHERSYAPTRSRSASACGIATARARSSRSVSAGS